MLNYREHPAITRCAEFMKSGGVIAYPTEAVWGLGCDPHNRQAVERIFELKGRGGNKGLILVAAAIQQVEWLLERITVAQRQQLNDTWPGHVTWLIPHDNQLPDYLCGSHATIAVRVSSHPVVTALCQAYGGPIVSTSANPQGLEPARDAVQAHSYFDGTGIEFAPGQIGQNPRPSQIRELATGTVIRA